MASYAALVSLLNTIDDITNHPNLSTSLDNLPIQPLLQKTGLLLDFIEGNNYGEGSKEAADLERKIASAAHAAQDLIESHTVDQIYRQTYLLTFLPKCVGYRASNRSKKSLDLAQINEEMDAIVKEADELKEKHRLGEEQQPAYLAKPDLMESGEAGAAMVGLDAELNQLLEDLTGSQSSRRIISIVGMGGSGKTTLAKNLYENLLIKEKFQFRAWATISQQINAHEVFSRLLSSLQLGDSSRKTVDELGLQLYKTLFGRTYLIVLDDIWSVQAWDEVKHFFPDNNNGSRILLTTRLSDVAQGCVSSLFMMRLLDEEKSWKLFCEKAFQDEDCPSELREVGEEIVRLCKGLALSIVVLGGLLRKSPKTVGYWTGVAENLKSMSNSKEKQGSLDVLSLSYNHLPPHLKPCFLYMRVFREDSKICVSRIIKLWIAEGFLKQNRPRVLEEIADGYINDLIDRNLILVDGLRKNGKVKSFVIHDLLRDLCTNLAEKEGFFNGREGMKRRLLGNGYIQSMKVRLPLTLSIMTQGCIKPSAEYRLLRVADEAHVKLLPNYCARVNLRYLAHKYRSRDFKSYFKSQQKLPSSISFLWNLQTLIIRNPCTCLILMPVEIWKMSQLKHVECFEMYIPGPPQNNGQDALLVLEKLQTLKGVVNLRLSKAVCRIIPNIKKLNLVYSSQKPGYDDSLIECLCNLDCLEKLESLHLRVDFPKLLTKKPTASFHRLLKKLILRSYRLEWDDMTMIGSLPQLEVLGLYFVRTLGERQWSPNDGQFLRLKFLRIRDCDLDSWDADASHFPVLEKLELLYLKTLKEIPSAIGDITTLQLIHVDRCCSSVAISAVRIKEDQLDNGGQLQVQLIMHKEEMESFNQMLETDGLTSDNIQLEISLY